MAITLLGGLGQVANLAVLFIASALFGEPFGLFAIALAASDMLMRYLTSGFNDGVAFFGAQAIARKDEDQLYRTLASSLAWPLCAALGLWAALYTLTPTLYALTWTRHDRVLIEVFRTMLLTLPLAVLVRLPVHATKIHLDVKWAVLVPETILPLGNVALTLVFWWLDAGAMGLALAWVGAHLLAFPFALYGFTRHFSMIRTLRSWRAGLADRQVLRFALPHSLNMGFNQALASTDQLMLSFWFDAKVVSVYMLVSKTAQTIRMARMLVVGIFAPLVARYQASGNKQGIQDALDSLSRWISLGAIPIAALALAFYPELIVGTGKPWPLSHAVVWLLSGEALLNAFWGLAGSVLLMSGHVRILLMNSSATVLLNVLLNLAAIPLLGPAGAALATFVAGTTNLLLMQWQMGRFVGIHETLRSFIKPLLAGLPVLLVCGALNATALAPGLALKVAVTTTMVFSYGFAVFLWPGDNPERRWWIERRKSRQRQAA